MRSEDVASRTPTFAAAFTPEYWLERCEGFRVRGGEGHIGYVEAIERDATSGRTCALSVRAGRIIVLVVPVEEIEEVRPGEELVVLAPGSSRFTPESQSGRIGLSRVA